jgi:hypothetical protein
MADEPTIPSGREPIPGVTEPLPKPKKEPAKKAEPAKKTAGKKK